jgi:PPK2 family polyphosphate:nucleotide phosphotransferase
MKINTASFRVPAGARNPLRVFKPGDTHPFRSKQQAEAHLERQLSRLFELQERLYADGRYALLVVLQAMDAGGKDSLIGHAMRGLNPQGTRVVSFKVPSEEEVAHDFLWRATKALPRKGEIAVFNRSYYEDVIVVRVHPEHLERQRLANHLVGPHIWEERFEDIRGFEQHLTRSGTVVCKFFLNLSKDEQARRMRDRLADASKNWKFSVGDLAERERWADYMHAYAHALSATSTRNAPWYAVPADHKWCTRAIVAHILVETLESLNLRYPKLAPAELAQMERAVAELGGKRHGTRKRP